jgi:hypothetical protein
MPSYACIRIFQHAQGQLLDTFISDISDITAGVASTAAAAAANTITDTTSAAIVGVDMTVARLGLSGVQQINAAVNTSTLYQNPRQQMQHNAAK